MTFSGTFSTQGEARAEASEGGTCPASKATLRKFEGENCLSNLTVQFILSPSRILGQI